MEQKHVGTIYKIINNITDEVYIGQTFKEVEKRWQEHKRDAKRGKKTTKLVKSFVKYGIDNFTFVVEEEVFGYGGYLLDIKETEYIDKYDSYKNGLNGDRGANKSGLSNTKYFTQVVNACVEYIKDVKTSTSFLLDAKNDRLEINAFLFLQNCVLLDNINLRISTEWQYDVFKVEVINSDYLYNKINFSPIIICDFKDS